MKNLLFALVLLSSFAWAKEMKTFNHDLIHNVQKDIQNDDEQFRKKGASRGPASVESEPEGKHIEHEKKLDKKDRQIGNQKW